MGHHSAVARQLSPALAMFLNFKRRLKKTQSKSFLKSALAFVFVFEIGDQWESSIWQTLKLPITALDFVEKLSGKLVEMITTPDYEVQDNTQFESVGESSVEIDPFFDFMRLDYRDEIWEIKDWLFFSSTLSSIVPEQDETVPKLDGFDILLKLDG